MCCCKAAGAPADPAGRFEPFRHEAADGQATVAWLRGQDWFDRPLGTIGASYLGYVQLALAGDPPPELKASVVQVGIHDPAAFVYPGGVFALVNVISATAATFSSQGLLRATAGPSYGWHLRWKRVSRHPAASGKPAARRSASRCRISKQWLDHEDPGDGYWRGPPPGPHSPAPGGCRRRSRAAGTTPRSIRRWRSTPRSGLAGAQVSLLDRPLEPLLRVLQGRAGA